MRFLQGERYAQHTFWLQKLFQIKNIEDFVNIHKIWIKIQNNTQYTQLEWFLPQKHNKANCAKKNWIFNSCVYNTSMLSKVLLFKSSSYAANPNKKPFAHACYSPFSLHEYFDVRHHTFSALTSKTTG